MTRPCASSSNSAIQGSLTADAPYAHLTMSSLSSLTKANLLVLGLLVLHTVDHAVAQESRALPGSSSLVGVTGFAITAVSSWLAIQRSPIAPEASTVVGFLTVAGVVGVHILPSWWTWVSDPYWDFSATFVNWLSLIALVGSAVYLTAVGLRYQRLRHVKPYYRH